MRMKQLNKRAFDGLTIGLAVWVAGCASSGYKKSEQTASSLQSSANRIERAVLQVNLAVATLNDLVNNPQADLRPQFKKFSAAVDGAKSLATGIREADKGLQARGAAFFDKWDKELAAIQNEDIRTRGQKRKQEVVEKYESVRAACTKTLSEYEPLSSDLNDVHRFLNSDLTPGGLAAIKDAATRVNRLAAPAQDSANKLVAEMRTVATAMSPQVVAEK